VVTRNDQAFLYKNDEQIINTILALRQIKDLSSLKIDKKYIEKSEFNFKKEILKGIDEPQNLAGTKITFSNNQD
jgi:transcription elongation factor